MKDENDILTKDMLKILKDAKKSNVPIESTAIAILYQIRGNKDRYFRVSDVEA